MRSISRLAVRPKRLQQTWRKFVPKRYILSNMRIGIITLPIQTSANYGGVIQNFAMQQILKRLGHTPVTLQFPNIVPRKCDLNFWQRLWFRRTAKADPQETVLTPFCRRHIAMTKPYRLPLKPQDVTDEHFDAYISGSDQIWHPNLSYKYFILASMMDFAKNAHVRRIAYAASFGRFQSSLSKARFMRSLGKYAKALDLLSVREDEGKALCREYFGYDNAVNVLDPTMLITGDDYGAVADATDASNALVTYILDESPAIRQAVDMIFATGEFGSKAELAVQPAEGKTQPTMETWLGTLKTGKFVVTDSFHGTVFAILFRRPFVTIANAGRGLSRFTSLLGQCGLMSRLVKSADEITPELCNSPIDFDQAHDALEKLRGVSIEYLRNALETTK